MCAWSRTLGGSSPLARGTRRADPQPRYRNGLIPARAGNTGGSVTAPSPSWAHPRSRGEHYGGAGAAGGRLGSSPLARGTLQSERTFSRICGLIPARAGNTTHFLFSPLQRWAHPRSRGEHVTAEAVDTLEGGSSPLARGTPERRQRSSPGKGLIPARAGNTQNRYS